MPSHLATNEKLILLVKDNPIIYDSKSPRDNQMMKNIWTSIAVAMGDDAVDAEGWKRKWRNIKDSYMRKKRQIVGRSRPAADDNRRQWPFMGMLMFLDKHFTHRRRRERNFKLEEDDEDSEAGCLVDMAGRERLGTVEDSHDNNSITSLQDDSFLEHSGNPPHTTKRERDQDAFHEDNDPDSDSAVNNVDDLQEYDESESSSYKDPDGNDSFFRSCSCRMNRLSHQAQSLLRLQISQLFFNAENPDIPDLAITFLQPKHASSSSSNGNSNYSSTEIG